MDLLMKIAAVLAAVLAGSLVLNLSDIVLEMMHPLPDYIFPEDKKAIEEHKANAPVYVEWVRMLFWAVGGLLAGWIATLVAPVYKPTYAYFSGLIFLCASVFFVVTQKSEWWVWIGALLTWIPASHLGYLLASRQRNGTKSNPTAGNSSD